MERKFEEYNIVRRIKKFYGINRTSIHIITGVSADALCRYERGEEIPKKFKLLFGVLENIEWFENLFHLSKDRLSSNQIEVLEKKLREEKEWRNRMIGEYQQKMMNINFKANQL